MWTRQNRAIAAAVNILRTIGFLPTGHTALTVFLLMKTFSETLGVTLMSFRGEINDS
jgi:hypothetical protein